MWQIKMKEQGRCVICGEMAVTAMCEKHREENRKRNLINQRHKAGIPLESPVRVANPVCKNWAKLEPENYMNRYLWAKHRLKLTPEQLETQAQDLLVFASMMRKYGK